MLCNTDQKAKIELRGKSVQATYWNETVFNGEIERNILPRGCYSVEKRTVVIDRCNPLRPYLKLSVKDGSKICVEQRLEYRTKVLAECKDNIIVSIVKRNDSMILFDGTLTLLFPGKR